MPSPDAILTGLGAVANQWRDVAVAWHAVLGAMLIGLAWGWRPSHRAAGFLLSTPLMSVSIAAWGSGNRFNAVVFAGLFASLMILAKGFSADRVHLASPLGLVSGSLLVMFGWAYPHFLESDSWLAYTYAAPLALLPCPTLAAVIGATLMFSLVTARGWTLTLASAGIAYGIVGAFILAVPLDYALLAGSLWLAAASVLGDPVLDRSVPADATRHVAIIQGHPDPEHRHFCHALADAYAIGAREAGHDVVFIDVARLDFPLARSRDDLEHRPPPEAIRQAQIALARADHIVLVFPIWNGAMPAVLKGFLEQTFRSSFIFPDARTDERLGFSSVLLAAKGADRQIRPRCRHDADAGVRLPVVLSPSSGKTHAPCRRRQPHPTELRRAGGWRRRSAEAMAAPDAGVRTACAVRSPRSFPIRGSHGSSSPGRRHERLA